MKGRTKRREERRTERLATQLRERDMRRLKAIAKDQDVAPSTIAYEVLVDWLDQHEAAKEVAAQ